MFIVSSKENDLSKLKEFISTKKPHVVAVTAESKDALRIVEDIQRLIQELTEEAEMPAINVELVDNEVAMVYENSNKGQVQTTAVIPLSLFLSHILSVSVCQALPDFPDYS